MKSVLMLLIISIVFSVSVFAQADGDFNRNEFYAGYMNRRSDDSVFSNGGHGFNAGYTRNLTRYFGIRGDVSGTYKNINDTVTLAGGNATFDTTTSFYTIHGGIQIKDNAKTSKVKPFAHALVGVANQRVDFRCTPAAACSPISSFNVQESGLSGAIGGGLDIKINDSIDVRIIQAEYNPSKIDGVRINNLRFGFGIVFKN